MKPYHAWTTTNSGTFIPSCLAISYLGYISHLMRLAGHSISQPLTSWRQHTTKYRYTKMTVTRQRSHPNGPTWVQLDVVRVQQSACHLPEADADNLLWRPVVYSFGLLGQLRFCSNSIADHLAWASLSEDEGPWVQYTRREVSIIPKLRQVPWLYGVIWGRGNWSSIHRSSSAFPGGSDGPVGVGIVLPTVLTRLSIDSSTTPSAGHQDPRRGQEQERRH